MADRSPYLHVFVPCYVRLIRVIREKVVQHRLLFSANSAPSSSLRELFTIRLLHRYSSPARDRSQLTLSSVSRRRAQILDAGPSQKACDAVCTSTFKSTNRMQDEQGILLFLGALWGGGFLVWAPYAVYRTSRRSKTNGLVCAIVATLSAWQLLPHLLFLAAQAPMGILLGSSVSVAALTLLRRRDTQRTRG